MQRTGSDSSLITDSAASASAVSTGFKTKNGYVSVDTEGKPLGSVLEAAKQAGYFTGLVDLRFPPRSHEEVMALNCRAAV